MPNFLDFATPLTRLLLVTLAVLVLSLPDTVGTEYGGMLRAAVAGDPEALERPCTCRVH